MPDPGRTVEIPATDVQGLAEFYGRAFACEIERVVDGSYRVAGVMVGVFGCTTIVVRARTPQDEAAFNVFSANSLVETARRVCIHGGSVVVVTTDPNGVRVGLFHDTEGNRFMIEQPSDDN